MKIDDRLPARCVTVAEEIHAMICQEFGTLYHVGDHTFIIPVYGYSLGDLERPETLRDAVERFWNDIASPVLKEKIKSHVTELRDYCRARREGES